MEHILVPCVTYTLLRHRLIRSKAVALRAGLAAQWEGGPQNPMAHQPCSWGWQNKARKLGGLKQ